MSPTPASSPPAQPGPESAQLASALATVRRLRARMDLLERAKYEPIAIVGMGCRVPGASSPAEFWQVLAEGVDAITETPVERWNAEVPLRYGGFIAGVEVFDPYFFGISPREAARMDPQQRHFLEVAWEAFEDAGAPREKLRGSDTGVFVGVNSADYLQLQLESRAVDTYTVMGGTNCIIANRLSYALDLRGPSLTVDSACSASLVAVHLACQSLRNQECSTAVAGGTHLMLSPASMAANAMGFPLAPDGRCKTFSARADGYARGEGIGAVVLKRLSDAVADRDRIWAVIRGSAVNQDGLTNGLTAPNGVAQRAVIEQALRNARMTPDQVTLLEAHGTGTALGDPIEVEALSEVYGEPAGEGDYCALGSVKTNIGHLEAGSGVVGLMKAALCLHHRTIAPSLHFDSVNPLISLADTRLGVPASPLPWDVHEERRNAAVSAFGAGGTNAHVILGPAPGEHREAAGDEPIPANGPWILPISAATAAALVPMVRAYRDHLASPAGRSYPFRDIAQAAATRRTQHEHRLVVLAGDHAQAVRRLTRWLDAEAPAGVLTGRGTSPVGGGVVFVFPGQGSQRAGMGAELMRSCPVFRDTVNECTEAMSQWLGRPLPAGFPHLDEDALLDRIDLVQPALFALAVGLAARCRSFGIEPDAVIGHSMGEVAAAHVAGALTLADATRIICRRAALLRRISGQGAMLLVALPMDQAAHLVHEHRDRVSVAVSNSPMSTVLSGDPEILAKLAGVLRARNVFCRPVKVDVASHSPQVDALREDLMAELTGLSPRPSAIPILSTVTGEFCDGSAFDAGYWVRNLREPVLFGDAVRSLIDKDHGVFVEMSAHPVLLSAVEQGFEAGGREGLALASMRRDEPEAHAVLEICGALHANGRSRPFTALTPDHVRAVPLPAYPWQHERFWFQETRDVPPVSAPPAVKEQDGRAEGRSTGLAFAMAVREDQRPERIGELVLDIVADVLRMARDRIDPRDGFFQMGMDSILATRVRERLEAVLGQRLPGPVMFEHPTVSGLAAYLSDLVTPRSGDSADVSSGLPGRPGAAPSPEQSDVDEFDEDELSEDDLLALLAEQVQPATPDEGEGR